MRKNYTDYTESNITFSYAGGSQKKKYETPIETPQKKPKKRIRGIIPIVIFFGVASVSALCWNHAKNDPTVSAQVREIENDSGDSNQQLEDSESQGLGSNETAEEIMKKKFNSIYSLDLNNGNGNDKEPTNEASKKVDTSDEESQNEDNEEVDTSVKESQNEDNEEFDTSDKESQNENNKEVDTSDKENQNEDNEEVDTSDEEKSNEGNKEASRSIKEEKEFIYNMMYMLEEKQPKDENGNPTTYIIEVKNQFAHYEVWNPGHLTGKGLKQGDLRDFTEERQAAILHSTAAGSKCAENIGRDWSGGVSANGMFDFGRNDKGEIDLSKLPKYYGYEDPLELTKDSGTELVVSSYGIECVEDPSDEIINMEINFCAIMNALTNTELTVCHGDIYSLQSMLKDKDGKIVKEGKVVRYAAEHRDPIILMNNPELKEKVINAISEQTKYYRDVIGINHDEYIEYARNRKAKEIKETITKKEEEAFSKLSRVEKQNLSKAYQYLKKSDIKMDEIGISGILGIILSTSKGNPNYTSNENYGIIPVNKAKLQEWAGKKGKDYRKIETQLEYYTNEILKNTTYKLGTDRNDGKYYEYFVNYGHLKFICPGDATTWNLLYAMEQDKDENASRMAEVIYIHRDELKVEQQR